MAHIFIGTDQFGCRNYRRTGDTEEYDANLCFCVLLGVPVWCSVRRCVHVAERHGACQYRELKPIRSLKWMMPLYWLVCALGILAFVGIVTLVVPTKPGVPPIEQNAPEFALVVRGAIPLFFLSLIAYRWLRQPSPRQEKIRGIVQQHWGMFSDPGTWATETAAAFVEERGMPQRDARALLEAAQKHFAAGRYDEMVLAARMALAFTDAPAGDEAQSAEQLTERALEQLGGYPIGKD